MADAGGKTPFLSVNGIARYFDVSPPLLNRLIERPAAPEPEGGRRRRFPDPPRRDLLAGRRVRLRQVDGGAAGGGSLSPDPRQDRVRRRRPRADAEPPGAEAAPAPHPDDLPGPLCQPQSALAGARHHRRADPHPWSAQRRRGDPRPRRGAAGPGEAGAGGWRPLSARVLRRPAPAHLHRPRAGGGAGVPGLRRADLGPRRLRAGADPQPDEGAAAQARSHLSLHLAQSGGGLLHLRPRRRDVSGPAGGDGGCGDALRGAAPSLYAHAARHHSRPRHDRPDAPAGGGRGAEPDRSADRLRLSSALPLRQRPLPDASGRSSAPTSGRWSPATRSRSGVSLPARPFPHRGHRS